MADPDQQAREALQAGDAKTAQALFEDPQWRGSAAYRAGDYQSAIDEFVQQTDADSHYNRGNALARAGDLNGAIEAYNQALEQEPDMEDAIANRELVKQFKQQQQEQEQQNQNQNQSQDQNQDQNQTGQNQNQQSGAEENQEQKSTASSEEQSSSQQQGQNQQQEANQPQERGEKETAAEEQEDSEQNQQEKQQATETAEQLSEEDRQAQQELEQWLRRVPDDPGGLLRNKFHYQSRQRALEQRRPAPPGENRINAGNRGLPRENHAKSREQNPIAATVYILIVALFLLSSSAWAALTATVDRKGIDSNESLQLRVRYAGQASSSEPDFSVLERDFRVLSNDRLKYTMINGRTESYTDWTLTLMPKRTGRLLIPSIKFKQDISDAIEITVRKASPSNATGQPVYTETLVDKSSLYVQEQLLLTHRLYTSIQLTDLSMETGGAGAIVQQVAQNQFRKRIGNRDYIVVEKSTLYFPGQRELEIPPLLSAPTR